MPWWWGRWRRRWRRRRPWRPRLRRRRARRAFPRRRRRRFVSRRWRRPYRRRRRRGRRRRRRRRRHKPTLVLRQWQPDVIRHCKITGWMPLIICGKGSTQFNYITHADDITPRGASYGGNFTNMTFSLEAIYEQFLYHRNRWSASNHDLELCRYKGTTLKLYRHPDVDYIVTYSRTGPFEISHMTYLSTHPLLMLLNKHHIVVPSLKTKPRGRKAIKVRIRPPKLMNNKWYFTRDFCNIGLFQLWATGLELRNPWLRMSTLSPCIGFNVLKNSVYTNLSNLPQHKQARLNIIDNTLHPHEITGANNKKWQYTYTKLMAPIYYSANRASTYDWENYSNETNYNNTYTKFSQKRQEKLVKIRKEWQMLYPQQPTALPDSYDLLQEYGLYSPYYLNPSRINLDWMTPYTHVRYNPLVDKGFGNRIYIQWCSEVDVSYNRTKSKCLLQDMPLFFMCYGYIDWAIKNTGVSSLVRDARICIRCPYTEPQLVGSTEDIGFVPISETFMRGDMPVLAPYIPLSWFCKWYPNIAHQKEVLEAIISCSPFMPRDQDMNGWDITIGYKMDFLWGGSPLPSQPIDDPCQQGTHPIPDPDKHPRLLQVSNPKLLGPRTVFHKWDIRRGQFSKRSIKRVSEYSSDDESLAPGLPSKRNKLDSAFRGENREQKECYSLLKALEEEETPEEEEPAPQEKAQKEELLHQLQLQRRHQRVLRRGLKLVFTDILRLRQGVHWNPELT
nr:MAG: ORF1 [Torque teno virus]